MLKFYKYLGTKQHTYKCLLPNTYKDCVISIWLLESSKSKKKCNSPTPKTKEKKQQQRTESTWNKTNMKTQHIQFCGIQLPQFFEVNL